MQKLILALAVSTAAGVCVDDAFFLDEEGNACASPFFSFFSLWEKHPPLFFPKTLVL